MTTWKQSQQSIQFFYKEKAFLTLTFSAYLLIPLLVKKKKKKKRKEPTKLWGKLLQYSSKLPSSHFPLLTASCIQPDLCQALLSRMTQTVIYLTITTILGVRSHCYSTLQVKKLRQREV